MSTNPGPSRDSPAFAAPYTLAARGALPEAPRPARRRRTGLLALTIAVVAGLSGIAVAVMVATRLGSSGALRAWIDSEGDLRSLTPVRDWILVGEVAFWTCGALGIASVVLAIVAIARRSGRATGITALVIALVSPVAALGAAVVGVAVTT
ncbi:MAG: hypothetical protein PGN24_09165 [Microbacterium arborescens]